MPNTKFTKEQKDELFNAMKEQFDIRNNNICSALMDFVHNQVEASPEFTVKDAAEFAQSALDFSIELHLMLHSVTNSEEWMKFASDLVAIFVAHAKAVNQVMSERGINAEDPEMIEHFTEEANRRLKFREFQTGAKADPNNPKVH